MRHWSATSIYYLRESISALNSGLIFTSLWAFYYEALHLTLTQVSLIYIIITITGMTLEIPTGVIADTYSRRFSIILGGVFIGLCYTFVGFFPFYIVILIGAFLEAVGDTFVSGALEAWITDEVGADNIGSVFIRSTQISTPIHWVGVLLSIGFAALFNYQVPIAIGGILWLLTTLILVAKMPETIFAPHGHAPRISIHEHIQSARDTFVHSFKVIRNHTIVFRLVAASLFVAALLDIFYRFSRLHILNGFVLPTIAVPFIGILKNNLWFGFFEITQSTLTLIGLTLLRRYTKLQHARTFAGILTIFYILILIGILLFANTNIFFVAIGAWLIVNVFNDVGKPVVATWLNQTIDSTSRATILSINSQVGMLGVLILGSGMSIVGDLYGVSSTLLIASTFLLPIIILYFQSWRQETRLATSELKFEG
ncbi:MAG: MFS transporter [Candidatus Kapabacteria bacterium]|nr:MFS transporter [Candidatus Kapabacteria bacterium]